MFATKSFTPSPSRSPEILPLTSTFGGSSTGSSGRLRFFSNLFRPPVRASASMSMPLSSMRLETEPLTDTAAISPSRLVRMRLIENLTADDAGHVTYRFRPSSPLCPIAIPLAQMIKAAVSQVPGVTSQTIEVTNYVQASVLTELLNQEP